ncbi:hypothetical protein H4F68_22395 [Rhodococcus globerulus]|nr:hypothetical protein [Rhodococcus globerulus]
MPGVGISTGASILLEIGDGTRQENASAAAVDGPTSP